MTPDILARSWSALTPKRAAEYLDTYGHPAESSKRLLAEVLREQAVSAPVSVIDLGCGNAHVYQALRDNGLDCSYTGVEFSAPLLAAAKERYPGDERVSFLEADITDLEGVDGSWDFAIYSHVVEMLAAPESSLRAAARVARAIAIRWFEPPEHDADIAEIHEMEIGDGTTVPYLRRKMSRDYYRLVLTRIGAKRVDVYRDDASTDQVHVLHFA